MLSSDFLVNMIPMTHVQKSRFYSAKFYGGPEV